MTQRKKYCNRIIRFVLIILSFLVILLASCNSLNVNKFSIEADLEGNQPSMLRIIHLSDIHIKNMNDSDDIEEIISTVNNLNGDILVFTGDYGNLEEITEGYQIFPKLKSKYKKYAVLGNHDYGDEEHAEENWKSTEEKQNKEREIKDLYKKWGFQLLLNESDTLSVGEQMLAVIGLKVYDPHHRFFDSNIDEAVTDVREIKNKILLVHNPDFWTHELVDEYKITLTLAGHTHGGQIGIGLGDSKISPAQLLFQYWRGIYEIGKKCLIVNTGLGYYGLPFRIGMDPGDRGSRVFVLNNWFIGWTS